MFFAAALLLQKHCLSPMRMMRDCRVSRDGASTFRAVRLFGDTRGTNSDPTNEWGLRSRCPLPKFSFGALHPNDILTCDTLYLYQVPCKLSFLFRMGIRIVETKYLQVCPIPLVVERLDWFRGDPVCVLFSAYLAVDGGGSCGGVEERHYTQELHG